MFNIMSTSKDSLEFIAYENGLELIETTSERNGYPANLKYAIIGFNSFEEAEKIAKDNNLSIEIFTKNDGWQLYYRTGNRVHEPFKNGADNYGDIYSELSSEDVDTFYEEEVKPCIDNFNDLDSLSDFIKNQKEILEKLELIGDDEKIITCDGCYYETIQKTSMNFYFDTKTSVIGLIEY